MTRSSPGQPDNRFDIILYQSDDGRRRKRRPKSITWTTCAHRPNAEAAAEGAAPGGRNAGEASPEKRETRRWKAQRGFNMSADLRDLFTIGHSIHPLEDFLGLLKRHGITTVADVRSQPFSRIQYFNGDVLAAVLKSRVSSTYPRPGTRGAARCARGGGVLRRRPGGLRGGGEAAALPPGN